jgi:hypothetical protein
MPLLSPLSFVEMLASAEKYVRRPAAKKIGNGATDALKGDA